jgi:hypothetical protein
MDLLDSDESDDWYRSDAIMKSIIRHSLTSDSEIDEVADSDSLPNVAKESMINEVLDDLFDSVESDDRYRDDQFIIPLTLNESLSSGSGIDEYNEHWSEGDERLHKSDELNDPKHRCDSAGSEISSIQLEENESIINLNADFKSIDQDSDDDIYLSGLIQSKISLSRHSSSDIDN